MRKVAFLVIACGLSSLPALADPREDVVNGLTRCAVLTDDRQWLDCYYGAAQPMRAQLGLNPAPQAQIQLLQQVQRPQAYGAAVVPAPPLPATVVRATARTGPPPPPRRSGLLDLWGGSDVINNAPIRSYEVHSDGFTVTLSDGEVWQQTDADKNPVNWHDDAGTMHVTITQAAMHTFNLVLNDENQHYKVKRVK